LMSENSSRSVACERVAISEQRKKLKRNFRYFASEVRVTHVKFAFAKPDANSPLSTRSRALYSRAAKGRNPLQSERDLVKASDANSVGSSAPSKDGALRVIIVDDNQGTTNALSKLVRKAGFEPTGYLSGQDALDALDGSPDGVPSAAVVDIHLPDINGLVLAQKLRERFGPTTPIIVVSGDTSMATLRSLSLIGATYFFPKPMNSAALVDQLKKLTR
jgi:CheY-like chemotaxis protein